LPEVKNPNLQSQGPGGSSGGGSNSTVFIWLLMLMALVGYQIFFNKPTPPPAPAAQSQQNPGAAGAATPMPQAQPQSSGAAQKSARATPAEAISAAAETETTVENELYKIVLTNRGAQVKHWILKKYLDTAGNPLDMVQPQAAQFGLPLALFAYDSGLSSQLNQALYQVTVNGAAPAGTGQTSAASVLAPATVNFHYAANGLDVVKTLHFDSSYVLGIDTEVKRDGVPVRALVEWPAGLGDMEEFLPSSVTRSQVRTSASSQFAWSINGAQDQLAAKKVSGNATFDQPYSYAGITDLYFTAAFLPDAPDRATVVSLHNTMNVPGNLSDPSSAKTPADVIGLAMGDTSGLTKLRLYAGPKSTAVLATVHATGADGKATGQDLTSLVHFGWMGIVAKPLFFALHFFRNLLGPGEYNWGWSIILFTALFTLLMMPTRFMMLKSSLKMMRIQPKVDAIKKRYANLKATDPRRQEMNAEMMGLYKQEGVNMYGGCLPMLVQMPLFIAYFEVLSNVIELRQAHWFWLTDLSMPDPLHILPILIIISMFFTQYITPSPGMDPAQRRMMAFMMPVMFGFMLWHYASGLALYWGTSNIMNLAMQIGINQSHIGKEMRLIAERRAAKAGGNKTIQGRK